MTRIAYLVTSAREMTLPRKGPPDGQFRRGGAQAVRAVRSRRIRRTVLTPDGNPPHADPYGLSWFFHYPDHDKDYLASVVRTFAHDVDDIRLTLHQNTELGLAAARRVALLLQQQGRSPAEARQVVCAAAKTAWRRDRQFADVLSQDGSLGLTAEQIQAEVDAQRADSERLAAERHRKLLQLPGFQHPVALSSRAEAAATT